MGSLQVGSKFLHSACVRAKVAALAAQNSIEAGWYLSRLSSVPVFGQEPSVEATPES